MPDRYLLLPGGAATRPTQRGQALTMWADPIYATLQKLVANNPHEWLQIAIQIEDGFDCGPCWVGGFQQIGRISCTEPTQMAPLPEWLRYDLERMTPDDSILVLGPIGWRAEVLSHLRQISRAQLPHQGDLMRRPIEQIAALTDWFVTLGPQERLAKLRREFDAILGAHDFLTPDDQRRLDKIASEIARHTREQSA